MSDVSLAHEMLGALVISVLAIGVLVGAEVLKRTTSLTRETTRKFAHTGSGFALLAIPFIIDSHWTVLLLSVSFAGIMFGTSAIGALQGVHGVGRGIGGVLWYPFTGWLLYYLVYEWLSGEFVLYAIPIMVLAAADAFGALVGTRYGQHRYEVIEGHYRSMEGSIAFALVAYTCIHIPLLLSRIVTIEQALLIALSVTLISTMLETVSTHGLDNLFVPFGVLFFLDEMRGLSVDDLWLRLAVLFAVAMGGLLVAWRKPNTVGALVGLILVAYSMQTLGGSAWLLPMSGLILVFVLYERLSPVDSSHSKSRYELGTPVAALTVPVILLLINTVASSPTVQHALYVAFLAALASNAAILFYMLPQHRAFRFKRIRRVVGAKSPFLFQVTPGKLAFAALGACFPVIGYLVSDLSFGQGAGALALGLGGLAAFVAVASLSCAKSACPTCGDVTIRGLYCCQDVRLGHADARTLFTPTFRRTYLMSNAIAATAATGLLWML